MSRINPETQGLLNALRQKMAGLKLEVDEWRNKGEEAIKILQDATDARRAVQEEKASLVKVIQLLEVEGVTSASQLAPMRKKLQEGLKSLEIEKMKLKEEKMDNLEDNLEKQLREVKEEEEVAERRMQESTSGQMLLQSDLARAELRLERGRVRLAKVEAKVNNARNALKALKFSKEDAEGLEMKRKEKLAELEEESRESEAKAEAAERAALALQTQVTRLENQVLAEEGKHFQLEQEMESFFKDLSDI